MIVCAKDKKIEQREAMRGGTGTVTITHHGGERQVLHNRMIADLVLPVGASIGEHTHIKETEFYLIREGEGVVIEADGEKKVFAGDTVITGNGESHSIKNIGKVPLVLTAVIVTEV